MKIDPMLIHAHLEEDTQIMILVADEFPSVFSAAIQDIKWLVMFLYPKRQN
ncbi:hypothetical protein Hanom_Chr04g00329981 [Helianthus anomalus]